ncbi:hypothetical protein [Ammonifex thiophilus]|uniref:DUF2197 domain-containing protein n=1 Tax=Ammonifex thiophilus TaxID=444093 RepID=A0A3D8P372_9THEO|nr:hypothetical protein [Ammonifex thiophilus]RDV83030.1 hypothetical protein DXX99_06430 [Ammonifex thiophilus]
MGKKVQQRCIICGRIFETEAMTETVLEEEEELLEEAPKKTKAICPLCEAKIKKEAEEAQKEPKPM